jgi:dihydroxyacetone kinase phosphotransfer subunit
MVGLVFISHSRALADALVGLVSQVTATDIPIAVAAGVGPERQDFGTDAVEIKAAIQSVYSPDGVLVLVDLGSAILSADMALDLLPPEMKEHIRFFDAPFVEGAIAAGVQVGLGVDELSMNPGGIPRAKAVLRAINLTDVRELSAQVLSAKSSQDSRKLAQGFFQEHLQDNMP